MQKRKRTACVWPMRQKKNLKWFSHKNRTRSLFFPQNFILCYFRKSSHFTYVYIHIFAPSPLLIDTFGQFPFLTSRLTLTVIPPPPLHMEFVQCSPEKEEEDSGWRSVYVWVGFWALMCWESVRKKVVVKWRCLAAPLPLTSVTETDHRGSAEGQSTMFRWLNVF